jgi:hypothetical protein
MSDDLKPCPFCGGEASKIPDANHSTGWEVGCYSGKCDVEPHIWAVHLETAVTQWNTRADADRIKQLERENAEIDQLFFNLYAEAFTKIKAVVDGKSTQSIKTIVYELLDAFNALAQLKGEE